MLDLLTIKLHISFMRQAFFLLVTALFLEGCASSAAVVTRPQVFDSLSRLQPVVPYSVKNLSANNNYPKAMVRRVSVATVPKEVEASEPRFTSSEWWQRENAKLSKAMIICRGCLPATVAVAAPPKALVPASPSADQSLKLVASPE